MSDFRGYHSSESDEMWARRGGNPRNEDDDEGNRCGFGGRFSGTCSIKQENEGSVNDEGTYTFDRTIFKCTECSAEWGYNPLEEPVEEDHTSSVPVYGEDPEWVNTCFKVKERVARPEQSARNAAKQIDRMKKAMKKGDVEQGIKSGTTFTSRQNSLRQARNLLGISRKAHGTLEGKICPPFQHYEGEYDKYDMTGIEIRNDVIWRISEHYFRSGLPPRSFHIRGTPSCILESHQRKFESSLDDSNDSPSNQHRICLESLLDIDCTEMKPWGLSHWLQRWEKTHPTILKRLLVNGGPMSLHFHKLLGIQSSNLTSSLHERVNGMLTNMVDFNIVTLNDESVKMIEDRVIELLNLMQISEDVILNDQNALQYLFDNWCTIGSPSEEGWEKTEFWSISIEKNCISSGSMKLTSIVLGLCVAQAIFELFTTRITASKAILQRVVFPDLLWTGCKIDQIIWGWGGLMDRLGRNPVTDHI